MSRNPCRSTDRQNWTRVQTYLEKRYQIYSFRSNRTEPSLSTIVFLVWPEQNTFSSEVNWECAQLVHGCRKHSSAFVVVISVNLFPSELNLSSWCLSLQTFRRVVIHMEAIKQYFKEVYFPLLQFIMLNIIFESVVTKISMWPFKRKQENLM